MFWKEVTKAYLNLDLNIVLNMNEGASKLPQNKKIMEFLNVECLHQVIQVGLTNLNNSFGLVRAFVTWGSKPTSTLKPFWSHGGAEHFKNTPPMNVCTCSSRWGWLIWTTFRQFFFCILLSIWKKKIKSMLNHVLVFF